MNRRQIICSSGAFLAASSSWAVAQSPGEKRFVLIILRGGLDSLSAVPPIEDKSFAAIRGNFTKSEELLNVGDGFRLHPALSTFFDLYRKKEGLIFHAVGNPLSNRSHFDSQDSLETAEKNTMSGIGWLNKALTALNAKPNYAVANGETLPLVLRGMSVAETMPGRGINLSDEFWDRVKTLYQKDQSLSNILSEGLSSRNVQNQILEGTNATSQAATAMGKLLASPVGPRIGVLSLNGFDTHARQNQVLLTRLKDLDNVISELRQTLSQVWDKTCIVCVTEFGRTVRINGTEGTDHGAASVAFATGGAILGGKIITQWPGLDTARLKDGRDLLITLDVRGIFKSVMQDHFGMNTRLLNQVFLDQSITPMGGFIKR